MQWPDSNKEWEEISKGFLEKWKVPNCLGAIKTKRFPVTCPAEFQWMFQSPTSGSCEFLYCPAVDANYHIYFGGMGYPGVLTGDDQMMQVIEQRKYRFPAPKKVTGGELGKTLPYSFVGSPPLKPRSWLRIPTSAKNDEEHLEIKHGLRAVEITYQILFARFGVLKTKIPMLTGVYAARLSAPLLSCTITSWPIIALTRLSIRMWIN